MKRAVLILAALAITGCSPAAWDATKLAARVACIIANAEFTDERIALVCNEAPDAIDFIHKVAGEHRAGVRRALEKPGVCGPAPTASVTPRVPACVYISGYREAYLDSEAVSP